MKNFIQYQSQSSSNTAQRLRTIFSGSSKSKSFRFTSKRNPIDYETQVKRVKEELQELSNQNKQLCKNLKGIKNERKREQMCSEMDWYPHNKVKKNKKQTLIKLTHELRCANQELTSILQQEQNLKEGIQEQQKVLIKLERCLQNIGTQYIPTFSWKKLNI